MTPQTKLIATAFPTPHALALDWAAHMTALWATGLRAMGNAPRVEAASIDVATLPDAVSEPVDLITIDGQMTAADDIVDAPDYASDMAQDITALVDRITDGKQHQPLPEGVAQGFAAE